MATTYEKIATTTLGSASSTIDFTSIGSGYTDLRLVLTGKAVSSASGIFRFNSDSATNYSYTILYGDGTSAASGRQTSQNAIGTNYGSGLSTTPFLITIDIFSYAGSTFKTSLVSVQNDQNGSGEVNRIVGLWRSTSAITAVNLLTGSGQYDTGTIATIYGILKA
jgi:hypothetical protein